LRHGRAVIEAGNRAIQFNEETSDAVTVGKIIDSVKVPRSRTSEIAGHTESARSGNAGASRRRGVDNQEHIHGPGLCGTDAEAACETQGSQQNWPVEVKSEGRHQVPSRKVKERSRCTVSQRNHTRIKTAIVEVEEIRRHGIHRTKAPPAHADYRCYYERPIIAAIVTASQVKNRKKLAVGEFQHLLSFKLSAAD
jgi:hypothetical protein